MLCLGIESTAHTFGASVVSEDRRVLSNEKAAYSTDKGGFIPADVARHHVEKCDEVITSALKKAGAGIKDISLISYSQAPGIGHSLRIGQMAAKSLSAIHKKPIIGVNHCVAHLEIGRMLFADCRDPVLLYASGANTQIIAYEGGRYRIFGETLDIGVGNFLDCFARDLGLGFPGGPKVQELAKNAGQYIELPYVVKGMDISLGGILTNLRQKIRSGKYSHEDLSYSAQETVFAMLIEVSERAMAHTGKKELLLGGGVACNTRLQEMAGIMCKERDGRLFVPQNQFLVDNAAMIAWLGILSYAAHRKKKIYLPDVSELEIKPYERTDEVEVLWR